MPSWDRRTPAAQASLRDALVREQLRDAVGPFSPFWRERLSALRIQPATVKGADDLARLPAVGERDVCPDGDPAGAARLVLQADEAGFAMHAEGPDLRKAIASRVGGKDAYRRRVEAFTRPTTYHWAGRAFTFPVASTRNDLDLVARAGNRAWQVLGLTPADVLVSGLPVAQRLDHVFLSYAALAAGAPALFPGPDRVAAAMRLVSATVLALPADGGAEALAGLDLGGVRTVLLVGAPSPEQRAAAEEAAGPDVRVLALYGPGEGRVLWAECRAGSGFHTYPDLDYVEAVDPDSGERSPSGELVVTQLGFRGTALLRWRTGDVVPGGVETGACPGCGRTVPRVPAGVAPGGFVRALSLRGGGTATVDLRAVAGALAGRGDLVDWRVEVRRSARDGADELVVFVVPGADETEAAVGAYRDVRATSGTAAAQVVVATAAELAALAAGSEPLSGRVAVRT